MARHVLGGPLDEGRASYQIELSVCEDCRRTRQQGGGELVEVTAQVADMASCDAQRLSARVGGETNTRKRAAQHIPPALRREVLRRDGRRCQVPGCRHDTFLDLHHVHAREDGGEHEADNLITLCGAHHRAAHDGELVVEGRVASGVRFKHADGSDYGAVMDVAATAVDAQAKAFQALRQLGFSERDARRALSQTLEHVAAEADTETRLRAALELLTAGAIRQAS
jgi:hypothetical protein